MKIGYILGIIGVALLIATAAGFIGHFTFLSSPNCPEHQPCPDCACGDCTCPESTVQECQALTDNELQEVCANTICQTRIVYRCNDTGEDMEELMNSTPEIRQMYDCMEHRTKAECLADQSCKWYPNSIPKMDCNYSRPYGEPICVVLPGQGTCFDLSSRLGTR